MKAKTFEEQFDENVDITASLDLSKAKRELPVDKTGAQIPSPSPQSVAVNTVSTPV